MSAKYKQVADQLAERIKLGEFGAGDPLPSIKKTAADYAMSYVSIQKAYKLLEVRGLIYTQNGRGSFVGENAIGKARLQTANLIFLHASTDLFAFEFLCTAILVLKKRNIAANVIYLEITSLSDLEIKVETADMNFVLTPSAALANEGVLRILQNNRDKVICFSNSSESQDLNTVIANDELTISAAIEHLKSRGHEQILFASIEYKSNEYTWHSFDTRMRYWRAYCRGAFSAAAEADYLFITPSRNPETIASELKARLQQTPGISAIICESTELCKALRVLTHARQIAIPGEISVIMLGDTQLNVYGSPPLTAMSSNFIGLVDVGVKVMQRLKGQSDLGTVCEMVIPCLVERDSVRQRNP